MGLTDIQIKNLQNLYQKKFGLKPTEKEALVIGIKLITLMKGMMLPDIPEIGKK